MKKTPPAVKKTLPDNRRRWLLLIWGAGLLALALRLFTAWEIARGEFASSIFMPSKFTDLRTYMLLAQQVAEGTFEGPFYYQPFYYSVFLVICRWLSGASVWSVVIAQAVLGAFTAMIAGMSGALIAGRKAGVITAYLTALCSILIFYTPFHQIATLQAFNVTLMAYWAIRAFQCGKLRYTVGFAFMAAIGSLTRGNILLIFIPLLIALCWVLLRRYSVKKMLFSLIAAVVVFLAVESPFIIYNSIQLGRLSGPSTAADAVLALGNTPEAPPGGRDPGLPAGPMEYPQSYHVWMADCEKVPVWKKILNYLAEEPASYLELTFRKVLLFWDSREIPNNVALAGEGSTSRLLSIMLPPGIIIALGLAGMLLLMKKLRKSALLALYITVIFYWGATAAFYNLSRFRAPILPMIAVFAGIFAAEIIKHSKRDDWKFIRTYGVLALLVGGFITFGAYEFYRTVLEKNILSIVRPSGTRLALPDGRFVQFYHGPMTFGGWNFMELKNGDLVSVKFPAALNTTPGKKEIELSVQSTQAGILALNVSGTPVNLNFSSVDFRKIPVVLPDDFSGDTVNIKVVFNSAQAGFIADTQRNYNASSVNQQPLNGEIVIRITR